MRRNVRALTAAALWPGFASWSAVDDSSDDGGIDNEALAGAVDAGVLPAG